MATCPFCDSPLEDGATTCPACGAEFAPLTSAPPESAPEAQQQPAAGAQTSQVPPQPVPQEAPQVQQPAQQPAPQQAPTQPPAQQRLRRPLIIGAIAALVAVILGVVIFAGGSGGGGGAAIGANDTWTVLCYYCGSNLETNYGLASRNLMELAGVGVADNATFVVETGGADQWQTEVGSGDHLMRLELDGEGYQVIDVLDRAPMGDQATLAAFVSWGVEAYPADHYVLLFWDHGGGSLVGVCSDELDHDSLSLPELAGGIATAGVTFDMVGFDTCLMATLETAQAIAPYASYMVASEEIEPGTGWAWSEWPKWFANPGSNVSDLGAAIVDSYMDQCEANGTGDTVTLSVVDLGQIDAVASAFASASEAMAQGTASPYELQPLVSKGSGVQSFGYANYVDGYTDMVDLGDLMACMDEPLGVTDDAVLAALDKAVVYERHGAHEPRATGLSVFYPLSIDFETFARYFELSTQMDLGNVPYLQFLAARTGAYDQVDWAGAGILDLDPVTDADAEGQIQATASINADGRYQVEITGGVEWVEVATFDVGLLLPNGSIGLLGSGNNLDLEVDNNYICYQDRFVGSWLQVGGAVVYAELVDMVADGDNPSYSLYSAPVEWTTSSFGDRMTLEVNLLIRYDYPTDSYSVVSVYDDMSGEVEMSGKATASLQTGDELRFLTYQTQDDGSVEVVKSSSAITWSADTEAGMTSLGDATFIYYVTVHDLFGHQYQMEPALIDFTNGERTAAMLSDVNITTTTTDPGDGSSHGMTVPSGMQLIGNSTVGYLQVPIDWMDRTSDYPAELVDEMGFMYWVDPTSSYQSATFQATNYSSSLRVRGAEGIYDAVANEIVASYETAGVYGEVSVDEQTFNGRNCILIATTVPGDDPNIYVCDIVLDRDGDGTFAVVLDCQGDEYTIDAIIDYVTTWSPTAY